LNVIWDLNCQDGENVAFGLLSSVVL
jgi:hypothetical protein